MKVLLMGASGVVGRAVTPYLREDFELVLAGRDPGEVGGQPVHGVDITDFEQTMALVKKTRPDAMINCAIADYRSEPTKGSQEARRRYYERAIEVNVRGAYHLYEAAARHEIAKFVFISSLTTVLAEPRYESLTGTEMPRPNDLYACTKLFGEQLGQSYSTRRGMSVTCLRLGQPYPTGTSTEQRWLGRPQALPLHVHMGDIAQAIALSLRHSALFAVYPIVSGGETSWVEPEAVAALGFVPRYKFHSQGADLREPEPA